MINKQDKHIISYSFNKNELLNNILKIHNQKNLQIDLDPMFCKGNFYKKLPRPKIVGDINPKFDYVKKMDATNMQEIPDNSINSVILDPPFNFLNHKSKSPNLVSSKYGILKMNWKEYKEFLEKLIFESRRVLKNEGLLIFKIQNYTNQKTYLSNVEVVKSMEKLNFEVVDEIILLSKNALTNHNKTQRHFRKAHSYFYIATKKGDQNERKNANKSGLNRNL